MFSTWIVVHRQYGVVQASEPEFLNKCYTDLKSAVTRMPAENDSIFGILLTLNVFNLGQYKVLLFL